MKKNKKEKQKGQIYKENPIYAHLSTIEEKIRAQIEGLCKQIEERIPTDGSWFADFSESFSSKESNVFSISSALFIERDEKRINRAYLGYGLLHPDVCSQVSVYLYNGNKKDLLEYLSKEETYQEIVKVFYDLDNNLRIHEV